MGYYDGNTTTALWNYAQYYAMNDNSYGTTFGPSTPGALNVVSGQTDGVIQNINSDYAVVPDGNGGYSLVSDTDPVGDVCSGSSQVQMGGQNVGDLLTAAGVTWGFFEGGFDLTITNPNGTTGCHRSTTSSLHRNAQGRLHSAPSALPVLRLNIQPAAHSPHLGPHDWTQR